MRARLPLHFQSLKVFGCLGVHHRRIALHLPKELAVRIYLSICAFPPEMSKFLAPDARGASLEGTNWYPMPMQMLDDGKRADITLKAHGGSVRAHRSVLVSVSPVFNAMFHHEMKEKLTSTVEIPDVTIEALQAFLLLLYNSDVPHSPTILRECQGAVDKHFNEIFEACHKYQVTRLVSTLNDALPRNLTPENCWDCLRKGAVIARFCELCPTISRFTSPASICTDYVMDNCEEVMKSESVIEEMQQNPESVHPFLVSLSWLVKCLLHKDNDDSTPSVSSLWHKYKIRAH